MNLILKLCCHFKNSTRKTLIRDQENVYKQIAYDERKFMMNKNVYLKINTAFPFSEENAWSHFALA